MAKITFECNVPATYNGKPATQSVMFQVEASSQEEAFAKAHQEATQRGAVANPYTGLVWTSGNNNTEADWEAVFGPR